MRRRVAWLVVGLVTTTVLCTGWLLRDALVYTPWVYEVHFTWATWDANRENAQLSSLCWRSNGEHSENPFWPGPVVGPALATDASSALAEASWNVDEIDDKEPGISYSRVRSARWQWLGLPRQYESLTADEFRAAVGWE